MVEEAGGEDALNIYAIDIRGDYTTFKNKGGLKDKIERIMVKIKENCVDDKLELNDGKTHFMIMISSQKRGTVGEMEDIEYWGKSNTW